MKNTLLISFICCTFFLQTTASFANNIDVDKQFDNSMHSENINHDDDLYSSYWDQIYKKIKAEKFINTNINAAKTIIANKKLQATEKYGPFLSRNETSNDKEALYFAYDKEIANLLGLKLSDNFLVARNELLKNRDLLDQKKAYVKTVDKLIDAVLFSANTSLSFKQRRDDAIKFENMLNTRINQALHNLPIGSTITVTRNFDAVHVAINTENFVDIIDTNAFLLQSNQQLAQDLSEQLKALPQPKDFDQQPIDINIGSYHLHYVPMIKNNVPDNELAEPYDFIDLVNKPEAEQRFLAIDVTKMAEKIQITPLLQPKNQPNPKQKEDIIAQHIPSAKEVFVLKNTNEYGVVGDYSYYNIRALQEIKPESLSKHLFGRNDFVVPPASDGREEVFVKLGCLAFQFTPGGKGSSDLKVSYIDTNKKQLIPILDSGVYRYPDLVFFEDMCPLQVDTYHCLKATIVSLEYQKYYAKFDKDNFNSNSNTMAIMLAHNIKTEIQAIINNNKKDFESLAALQAAIAKLRQSKELIDVSVAEAFFKSLPDQEAFLKQSIRRYGTNYGFSPGNGFQKALENIIMEKIKKIDMTALSFIKVAIATEDKVSLSRLKKNGIMAALEKLRGEHPWANEAIQLLEQEKQTKQSHDIDIKNK